MRSVPAYGSWLCFLEQALARTARRSLIAGPFILVAVPSIFSVDGRILQIWELGPVTLTPTHEGLMFVATLMLKGWIAVTASVVLASTTRYLDIAAALRWFRVPALLVAVMEMMYRYVFLLGAEARRMLSARRVPVCGATRTSDPGGKVTWRAKVAGQMAGSLFIRTLNRGERVHMAMASRGYDGGAHGGRNAEIDGGRSGRARRVYRGSDRCRGRSKGDLTWQLRTASPSALAACDIRTRTVYPAMPRSNGVDLTVMEGEKVALLGPNGAGKTTLLLHLNGSAAGQCGDVEVFGRCVTGRQQSPSWQGSGHGWD